MSFDLGVPLSSQPVPDFGNRFALRRDLESALDEWWGAPFLEMLHVVTATQRLERIARSSAEKRPAGVACGPFAGGPRLHKLGWTQASSRQRLAAICNSASSQLRGVPLLALVGSRDLFVQVGNPPLEARNPLFGHVLI